MHGLMWTLPKKMFTSLDHTDSVALSIVPAAAPRGSAAESTVATVAPRPLRAHALVYGPDGRIVVPAQGFLELQIAPQAPHAS